MGSSNADSRDGGNRGSQDAGVWTLVFGAWLIARAMQDRKDEAATARARSGDDTDT